MVTKQKMGVVELLVGAMVVISFLVEVYLYPLYTSTASSIFFTLILPIIFAVVVIAGSIHGGVSLANAIVGIAAVTTLIIGSGSVYAYVSTEGGVFFGGLITVVASIGLFTCVLIREIYYRTGRQRNPKLNSKTENT